VRPIKRYLGFSCGGRGTRYEDFEVIEEKILQVIAQRFSLMSAMPFEMADFDLRMLATERQRLFPASMPEWECLRDVRPFDRRLVPVYPFVAKSAFIDHLIELEVI